MVEQVTVKTSNSRVEVKLTDWRFLLRQVKKIDPAIRTSFVENARSLAREVESPVKKAIPNRFVIRGMQPKVVPGRMTWGGPIEAKTTEIRIDTRIRKKGKSIASVWVMSPAVAMADMAKSTSTKSETKSYRYSRSATGFRTHKLNGQGRAMIQKLNSARGALSNAPSRYVWPAALRSLNNVVGRANNLVNEVSARVNSETQRNVK